MPHSSRTFATNYAVQLAGRVLTMVFGLVTVGVLTRALSSAQYGEYTTALTFLQFFGVVVDFGLTLTLIVMVSEHGADENRIVGNLFSMRFISGLLLFSLAPFAVHAFPYTSGVKMAVLVGALGYVCMSGATMLVGIYQKHAAMWRAALAETINRTILLTFVIVLANLHAGLVAMVAATTVANVCWLLATMLLAEPYVRIRFRFDWNVWGDALKRSWPIALSILFNLVYLKGDVLILSLYRTSSEVAVYGVAYKVLDVLTALPVMFMGLLLPTLVADWSAGVHEGFRAHLARAFDLFAVVTIPLVVGAQATATRLVELIAGERYAASGPLLQVLVIALGAVFFSSLYGHTVVAIEKQKPMTWGYAASAVLTTVGYLIFIPRYGAWGAAGMTLFSELFIAIVTFWMVWKTVRAIPSGATLLKATACAALMYGALWILPSWFPIIMTILIGICVYFAAMVTIGGIDIARIRSLWKPE